MFVSLIEGRTGSKPATREEELEYDRKHWVEEEGIPFQIAIFDTKEITDSAGRTRRPNPETFTQYMTGGYPSYFVVDKNGIIRYIQIGHRGNLEEKFAKLIERLSKEPSVAAR